MYPGKQPDYPGLLKQGWIEFTTPDGQEGLYHATLSESGTYMEVVRKSDDHWKGKDFPRQISQGHSDEELAVLLFGDDQQLWGDYQGTLARGDQPDRAPEPYGQETRGRERADEPLPDPDRPRQ